MVITAANFKAEKNGINVGMVVADAKAILPDLKVEDDKPDLAPKLLKRLAEWCILFTPVVAIDLPDGLLLDATGCPHLWGGDSSYLKEVIRRLSDRGYDIRAAMAGTIGIAWGAARYGMESQVIPAGLHVEAMMGLPPEALRLEAETAERLHKLGLHQIRQFIGMPRQSLRRRFGNHFMSRLDMAVGQEIETIEPVVPVEPYQERLPCMEPILTAESIAIALKKLLEDLCLRLQQQQKGLRSANFKCYRIDGKVEQIGIVTSSPSHHVHHLFKLFEFKISTIEPALGIELFILEAPVVEDHNPKQEKMWDNSAAIGDMRLQELMDRLSAQMGVESIHQYAPDEHHWPERSYKPVTSLHETLPASWRADKIRPLQLLSKPEPIEVTAPIPDYPPMLFRYKGELHKIIKSDGPERIEQEWWLQQGQHRDYYRVEDEEGRRYWLFRLGHYDDKTFQWFIHGFFD